MQGRGFLTGAIKKFEDVPETQRAHNPRMSEEENFSKVSIHCSSFPQMYNQSCSVLKNELTFSSHA